MVAEIFEKEHKNVLRDIKELLDNCSKEFSQLNFELSIYILTAQNCAVKKCKS